MKYITIVLQVLSILKSTPLVKLVGLHCHIGSTISDTSVYKDVAKLFMDMVQTVTFSWELSNSSFFGGEINQIDLQTTVYFIEIFQLEQNGFSDLEIMNLGGGLGINYHHDQSDTDVPGPDELVAAVAPHLLNTKFIVMIEPGRSLIGNAGI